MLIVNISWLRGTTCLLCAIITTAALFSIWSGVRFIVSLLVETEGTSGNQRLTSVDCTIMMESCPQWEINWTKVHTTWCEVFCFNKLWYVGKHERYIVIFSTVHCTCTCAKHI